MKTNTFNSNDFDFISLKLASPDRIKEWSHGEVTKPETINYRTGRSERGGLFDERIFGPEKDYECYCGKYRRIRYKGIVCEKCGVEVTKSIVRRERMGHIELGSPVAHIWFLRGIPSRIAMLMNIQAQDVEKVIYFAGYVVTSVNQDEKSKMMKNLDSEYKTKIKALTDEKDKEKIKELLVTAKKEIQSLNEGMVLDEVEYHKFSVKYSTIFEAKIGAEAIYEIFKKVDLERLRKDAEESLVKASSVERAKIQRRLGLIKSMIASKIRPEWMFLTTIPVIPPALRPMVALEGGRHATSDVNDLYRRVINRNNRLKKLKEINAPDVILRNEKRILQEAVDALIDNSIRHQTQAAMSQAQKRTLRSLADALKSKQGLFRQNLLGKRVDYSGRSVIVVGPDLKLSQCGLPKHMALELFRPFVISKLLEKELAYNIRGANRLIDDGVPEVWAILEEVTKDKYVLLNRAPTLHRLGIQAFKPVLIEGNAIQVHPLVCKAFNADFDGDQMAVHVPLSKEAQKEAAELMAADKNLLGPGSGEPIVDPRLDIVLGCFWMTRIIQGDKGEGKIFSTPNNAITAYDFGEVGFRAKVKVLGTDSPKYSIFEGKPFETSVGRLLFNSVLPKDFSYVNKDINNKELTALLNDLISIYGISAMPNILDKIKNFGFKYTTHSGVTWGIDEIKVPEEKKALVKEGQTSADLVISQYNDGLLSEDEKYKKIIEVWQGVKSQIEKIIPGTLDPRGSVYDMIKSGARGNISQVVQMAGMKGLIINTSGETIAFPIINSMKEGLTPLEYFITTHGSRKGLADTALNTAKAGYLTRRLVYVADNAIITEEDCGTKEGRIIKRTNVSGFEVSLAKNIKGRMLSEDVLDKAGKVIFKKGTLVSKKDAKEIEDTGVLEVSVRSPLACRTLNGLCQACYGIDLGRNEPVKLGEPVGIVAAQAIGEPGTQLTMRTFHSGGVAQVDITMGLPRVEEIFEKRMPKSKAAISESDGVISDIKDTGKEKIITVLVDKEGAKKKESVEYQVPWKRAPLFKVGDSVKKGDAMTDGSADIGELFNLAGAEKTENYIIDEILKVYELQGASISRKHIEVIIKQMFSRSKVKDPGDTKFVQGEIVENSEMHEENQRAKDVGKDEARAEKLVLGISEVSLTTRSFLSAASFQNTTRILIDTAVRGGVDELKGLKENVIIGRLIPSGTGFDVGEGEKEIEEMEE